MPHSPRPQEWTCVLSYAKAGDVGFLEMLEIVSFYEFLVFGDVLGFELLKMMDYLNLLIL